MAIEKVKRILDSVHGYVLIPDVYMNKIIDTPEFQRLRRIEQTSCRALFPSARHDRFIHSIGVFHLGTLIADHLWAQACASMENHEENAFPIDIHTAQIIATYRIACLLHDIGHTPFSHTFEKFFNNEQNMLLKTLQDLIPEDNRFQSDFEKPMPDGTNNKLTPHEFLSAIIAVDKFGTVIEGEHVWKEHKHLIGNKSLLARMIVGCKYTNPTKSLENAFIELIHGYVIDADGLDYACRDVWASGYSTSKIDISRLIESIRIFNNQGIFEVCYDAKAINEILSVLQVKSFQSEYVFSHHSVVFEQHLLVEAMKSVACHHEHIGVDSSDKVRTEALQFLCHKDILTNTGHTTPSNVTICYAMDDDFVSLMKTCYKDVYATHWFSRKYDFVPLWKTREAFISDLPAELLHQAIREEFWLYTDEGKNFLKEHFGMEDKDIMILDVDYENRNSRICKIKLYVNHSIHPFEEYYKDIDDEKFKKSVSFKYIYVSKKRLNKQTTIETIKRAIMEKSKIFYNGKA